MKKMLTVSASPSPSRTGVLSDLFSLTAVVSGESERAAPLTTSNTELWAEEKYKSKVTTLCFLP